MDAESASSVFVSRTLDELGYNQEMVRFRQQIWENCLPSKENGYTIIAGSKGEGVAKYLESDTDCLYTNNFLLCSNRDGLIYNSRENLTLLQLDRTHTAPGYTMLICVKLGTITNPCFQAALMGPIAGRYYLYSDRWREMCRQISSEANDGTFILEPVQGPSNPETDQFGRSSDKVFAIECDCPEIREPWLNRNRRYNWPHTEIIEDIYNLEAHVVPVGFKESPSQFLEWRICFTRAEIKLVQSFNNCQTKLIILLKMIAKNSLKHICKEMTTYVMKNVVFWIAELHPPQIFHEQNLLLLLTISLRFLKQCLVGRYLPSNMILERNLLANAFGTTNGSRLCKKTCTLIDTLLREGPRMVLRCEKIRNAWILLYTSPEKFLYFSYRSKQAEIIGMLIEKYQSSNELDERGKAQLLDHLSMSFIRTVLPDIQELILLGEAVVEILIRRIEFFLS